MKIAGLLNKKKSTKFFDHVELHTWQWFYTSTSKREETESAANFVIVLCQAQLTTRVF